MNTSYYVAFRHMGQTEEPLNNLYALDFDKIEATVPKAYDFRVAPTIIAAISRFIESRGNAIIHFLCDSTDYRHLCRAKLFSKWFISHSPENWIKFDINIDAGDIDYQMSFLYDSSIYSPEQLESEIVLTIDVLERSKD